MISCLKELEEVGRRHKTMYLEAELKAEIVEDELKERGKVISQTRCSH